MAIDSTAELIAQFNASQPGDEVTLTVIRGGETIIVTVTLGEWPDNRDVTERRQFRRSPPARWSRHPGESLQVVLPTI